MKLKCNDEQSTITATHGKVNWMYEIYGGVWRARRISIALLTTPQERYNALVYESGDGGGGAWEGGRKGRGMTKIGLAYNSIRVYK